MRSVQGGTLDAALLALEANIGDVEREIIGPDLFVLATPVGHPLAAKAGPAKASELKGASVLLLDDRHCFREQALAFCSGAKAHEIEFRATSLSTLAQMVASGSGVTLLPELAVATEAKRAPAGSYRSSRGGNEAAEASFDSAVVCKPSKAATFF